MVEKITCEKIKLIDGIIHKMVLYIQKHLQAYMSVNDIKDSLATLNNLEVEIDTLIPSIDRLVAKIKSTGELPERFVIDLIKEENDLKALKAILMAIHKQLEKDNKDTSEVRHFLEQLVIYEDDILTLIKDEEQIIDDETQ